MRAAGIGHGAFHRLRHTTGTELRRHGVTLEEIQLIARRRQESPYRERKLQVELRFSPSEARLTLRHQGQSLWDERMLQPLLDEQLDDPSMRAAVLMQSFCDAAKIHPNGTEVTLIKRKCE